MHNLLIKKALSLDDLKREIDRQHVNSLLPSINELIDVAKFKNIEPIVYYMQQNHKTIGATVLFKQRRKVHGFYLNTLSILGYDFFDYNFFFCKEEHEKQFFDYIIKDAKIYKVDLIVLDNILSLSKKNAEREELVYIFNSKITDHEKGFNDLLDKKSVIRHYKKANKSLNYTCEHKEFKFLEEDIENLAEIHKERWCYDDIVSAFHFPNRVGLYSAHCNNKILTVLKDGNDIIASHYGMIFSNTLLWHTPAINIKYLSYSPVEILLFEISTYCKANKITILDFGLGNETYKARFSNTTRSVFKKILPVSVKGMLSYIVINNINTSFLKLIKKNIINYSKKKYHAIKRVGNDIFYYKFSGIINEQYIKNKSMGCHLIIVTEFEKLVDIFRKNKISLKKYQYSRIKSGSILFCLMRDQELLSYGWGCRQNSFHVSEINCLLCNKNKIMLYDFLTPENLRGCGYYTILLIKICSILAPEEIVIFAERKNHASNKAIKRAGFTIESYQTIVGQNACIEA